jgi:hypothetical protein
VCKAEYKEINEKVMKIPIPFATPCLCETGFSATAAIKWKYRQQTNVERDIRIAISEIKSRFEKLCGAKQGHHSY